MVRTLYEVIVPSIKLNHNVFLHYTVYDSLLLATMIKRIIRYVMYSGPLNIIMCSIMKLINPALSIVVQDNRECSLVHYNQNKHLPSLISYFGQYNSYFC